MGDFICSACGHSHKSQYPENYPYPDTVCSQYPESCNCIKFTGSPIVSDIDVRPMICRRCGMARTSDNTFHQAECLSEWVPIKENT